MRDGSICFHHTSCTCGPDTGSPGSCIGPKPSIRVTVVKIVQCILTAQAIRSVQTQLQAVGIIRPLLFHDALAQTLAWVYFC